MDEELKDAKPSQQVIDATFTNRGELATKPPPKIRLIDAVQNPKHKELLTKGVSYLATAFIAFLILLFGMTCIVVLLKIAGII